MVRGMTLAGALLALLVGGAAMAQRGPCGMAMRGAAAATPQQKAFVAEATRLRDRMLARQEELRALQAQAKPSASAIQRKQDEVARLREGLHAYNVKNREVRLQMGLRDCSTCPNAATCDGCRLGQGPPCNACPNNPAATGQGRGLGVCPYGNIPRGPAAGRRGGGRGGPGWGMGAGRRARGL